MVGGVGAKPELHNCKHVLGRKCRDLLRLKHGGALQFSEALTSQFDKMATSRRRVLKVVVHRVDGTQVRLKRPGIDRACFEEVAQVGHDCL